LKQKKRASKGKTARGRHPTNRVRKTSSTSYRSAKRTPVRKRTGGTGGRKVSGSGKSRAMAAPRRAGPPSKKANARGLKAGSDSRAEQLRSMLESKRSEILEEVRRARQDSMEDDRTSFPEVGDLVSASVEKEKAFEYGELGVNALREIDDALEKLKEGTYGICEICGKPIGLRRLKVMPSARLCVDCKSKEEASGR
jgi:DnaK suppressor protein